MGKKNEKLDEQWLMLFYERVTNQFTLSRESLHNTHQWAISLTFGIVTAIFTISSTNPYPNEYSFVALLLTLPLMIRFFIRSCLEYSIQRKWQEIRNRLDIYFSNRKKKQYDDLKKCIDLYYFKWESPISIWKIIWDNLSLAYLWPFVLYGGLIIWGSISLFMTNLIKTTCFVVFLITIFEISRLICYRGFKKSKV